MADPLDGGCGLDGAGCGRRGGGRGPGGGRGRGRVFDNGDLRLVIMLLSEKPRHGYEIIKALEERVGGGYSPSPGVVYPTLTLLEELGQASVSDERAGRKLYTLTKEGKSIVVGNRRVVDAILARVAEAATARAGPPPPVVRAMENLGMALRLRLQARPATTAQIRAMAAAIDGAARSVEEL
jgi:DNA-binding PadR family transcriptional regulator